MNITRNRRVFLIPIFALIFFWSGRFSLQYSELRVDHQVQVVENKGKALIKQVVTVKKELTIGKLEEGGSIFGQVAGLAVASDGRIFVLDLKDKKLKIFDSTGEMLKELGREGQGPGEWLIPAGLQLLFDQTLIVNDGGNRKLIFMDLEGNILGEISYAKKQMMLRVTIFEDGSNCLGVEMGMAADGMSYDIAVYDGEFNQLFKIDSLQMPLPFGDVKINPFESLYDYSIDPQGNIIYGRGTDYEIKYFTKEGKLFRIVRKEYRPQRISEKDKEDILKMIPETPGINLKERIVFPQNFPAFSSLFLDEEDRLYVRTYERGKAPDTYVVDVFNAEGVFIARGEFPGEGHVFKKGKLYAVEKDDEDYHYICRYQVSWK